MPHQQRAVLVNIWAFFIVPAAPNVPLSIASAHVLFNIACKCWSHHAARCFVDTGIGAVKAR
jgi:hypothetical protein